MPQLSLYDIMNLQLNVVLNESLTAEQKIKQIEAGLSKGSVIKDGVYYTDSPYLNANTLPSVDYPGRCGWTLLQTAARVGDLGLAKWLIEKQKANINLANDNGVLPLSEAAKNGQVEFVKYLLSLGVKLNADRVEHDSPLESANAYLELVKKDPSSDFFANNKKVPKVSELNEIIKLLMDAEAAHKEKNKVVPLQPGDDVKPVARRFGM